MPMRSVSFQDLAREIRERHIRNRTPLTQLVSEALEKIGVTDPEMKLKLLDEVIRLSPNWKQVKRGLVEERHGRDGRVYRASNGFQADRDD